MTKIYTFPQRSAEWFRVRLGVISASHFSDVLAKGKGKIRHAYMTKLCAEILTGTHKEGYCSADMRRGIEQEPAARAEYEFSTGNEVNEIGFAISDNIGCSPDGLININGGLEIKCVIPEVQIETLRRNDVPPGHKAQIQGCMLVLNCVWWDFISYSPLMERHSFIKRVYRDGPYICHLQDSLDRFYDELMAMVTRIRRISFTPRSIN
jgi:hypothetical protein